MYRQKTREQDPRTAEIQPLFDIEFADEKPQSPAVDEKIRSGLNDIMQEQRELPRLVHKKDPEDIKNAFPLSRPVTEARDIGSATYIQNSEEGVEDGWVYEFDFESLKNLA